MLSPKYEGSDLRLQLLREAFKQSFLEGQVPYADYLRGRDREAGACTSMKYRFGGATRALIKDNPYSNMKVQSRAQQYHHHHKPKHRK